MSDNIPITPGSGVTIAAENVSGVYYQVVKVAYGALDTATDVSASAPLPVSQLYGASGVSDVASTFTATGQSSTFPQAAGRPFNIWLSNSGTAVIQLEASPDGGTTWFPLYAGGQQLYVWSYSGSALKEQAVETQSGLLYRLNCTAYTTGTVSYRMSQ